MNVIASLANQPSSCQPIYISIFGHLTSLAPTHCLQKQTVFYSPQQFPLPRIDACAKLLCSVTGVWQHRKKWLLPAASIYPGWVTAPSAASYLLPLLPSSPSQWVAVGPDTPCTYDHAAESYFSSRCGQALVIFLSALFASSSSGEEQIGNRSHHFKSCMTGNLI